MVPWSISPEEWLVRSALTGGVLLLGGVALMCFTPQPARRQRLGEFALLMSLLVAGLCALPAWSPIAIPIWKEPATAPRADADTIERELLVDADARGELDDAKLQAFMASNPARLALLTEVPTRNTGEASWDTEDSLTAAATPEPSSFWRASLPWLVTGYVLMTGFLLVRCLLGYLGLSRIWQHSTRPPHHVADMFSGLTRHWRHPPRLGVSERVPLPVSFGLWRPTVLIPHSFCAPARRADLRTVLVHELTHLERCDSWSCLLIALGQALWFYLPWFWWLRQQVRLCQEYVADAAAAALTSSEDYAEYLVSLSGYAAPRLPVGARVMGVKGSTSDLFRRVTMLLNASESVENRPPRWWSMATAAGFFAVAVLVSGIGLRARAQADDSKTEKKIEVRFVEDGKERKAILFAPDSADEQPARIRLQGKDAMWLKDLKPFLGTENPKQIFWTTSAPDNERVFTWVANEPSAEGRLIVVGQAGKDDKRILAVSPDGKIIARQIEIKEGGDGKRYIIVIEIGGEMEGDKKLTAKPMLPVRVERQVKVEPPRDDAAKKQVQEALQRALEAIRKSGDKDHDALRQQLEEALKRAGASGDDAKRTDLKRVIHLSRAKQAELDHAKKGVDFIKKLDETRKPEAIKKLEELKDLKTRETERAMIQYKKALEAAGQAEGAAREKAKAAQGEAEAKVRAYQKLAETVKSAESLKGWKAQGGSKLGVSIGTPSEALVAQLDLPKGQGIVIESVVADSPAAKAGFKAHDILVEFNGKAVGSDVESFVKAVSELKAGAKVDAVVLRKGQKTAVRGIVLADAGTTPEGVYQYRLATPKGEPAKYDFKLVEPKRVKVYDEADGKLKEKAKPAKAQLEIELKQLDADTLKKLKNVELELKLDPYSKDALKKLESGRLELKLDHLNKDAFQKLESLKRDVELKKLNPDALREVELELKKLDFDVKRLEELQKKVPADKQDPKKQLEIYFEDVKRAKPDESEPKKKVDLFFEDVKTTKLSEVIVTPKVAKPGVIADVIIEHRDPVVRGAPITVRNTVTAPRLAARALLSSAEGKKVTLTVERDNDKFTAKSEEANRKMTVTGTVKDGKAAIKGIVIDDAGTEAKFESIDKAPERFRERLKKLVELVEKGKVEFNIED